MNVRRIIESYEKDITFTTPPPPQRAGVLRPRPRQQASTPPVTGSQRSLRAKRPPSLKLVTEEKIFGALKECTNEIQVEHGSNTVHFVALHNYTFGLRPAPSPEPPRAAGPALLSAFGTPVASPNRSSSSSLSIPNTMRLASQRRTSLRVHRQQRYLRDESALAAALQRPTEYERSMLPKPPEQPFVQQLKERLADAKARLAEMRVLIRDDTTDRATHETLLRARWMTEHWITATEAELARTSASLSGSAAPEATASLAPVTRRDINLAHFFAHSPTRTTHFARKRESLAPVEPPRRMTKHNVEPPRLRRWPLTAALRKPLGTSPIPPCDTKPQSQPSGSSPSLPSPPGPSLSPPSPSVSSPSSPSTSPSTPLPSSPSTHSHWPPSRQHSLKPTSPTPEMPTSLQGVVSASTFSTLLDTPLDDPAVRAWPGSAVIYVLPQPSDEELLATLHTEMEAHPMPDLSRRASMVSSRFELISRPSVDAYEYPTRPRSRLTIRRNPRSCMAPTRVAAAGTPGFCPVHEQPGSPTSQRSSVFARVRRSMTSLGRQ
ncbi:hypothetical protein BC834DRAFT_83883 [Gloeopeniophorella convolvens]|nr:hypothetical protein BC834DRAFT_83883 [Gloeopeniophorella convolvens]